MTKRHKLIFVILILTYTKGFSSGNHIFPITYNLSYFYDSDKNYSKRDISEAPFCEIKTRHFNNGLKNGTYWFKIEFNDSVDEIIPAVFEVREPYIKESRLYVTEGDSIKLLYKTGNNYDFDLRPIKNRNIAYPVSIKTEIKTFFLKVDFHRNVSLIFYVHRDYEYYKSEIYCFLQMGVYYGISCLVILINILCYFSFKERIYLFYSLSILFFSFILMHLDGIIVFFFKPGWLLDNLDIVSYCLLSVFAGYKFASEFLDIKTFYPKSLKIEKSILMLTISVFLAFILTNNAWYFAAGICTMLGYFSYYWTISLLLIRKNRMAKFITIGYSILFLISTSYAIPVMYDFDFLNKESSFIKLGGLIGMLFFLYSLIYRSKFLKNENQAMLIEIKKFVDQIENIKSNLVFLENKAKCELSTSELKLIQDRFCLTEREADVIQCIAKELTNTKIADMLCVSVNTVKYHIRNIYLKLDVNGRNEVIKKLRNVDHEQEILLSN